MDFNIGDKIVYEDDATGEQNGKISSLGSANNGKTKVYQVTLDNGYIFELFNTDKLKKKE